MAVRSIAGVISTCDRHTRLTGSSRSLPVWSLILVLASTSLSLGAGRGDSDDDGDIDLLDYRNLQLCLPESDDPPPFVDCGVFDFNGDEVVDLVDYESFFNALLGPGVIPPRRTDSALIIGTVFHAETREPLEGARITAAFLTGEEEQDHPPVALSNAEGQFEYRTVPFEGEATFLVRIRKDKFAENLRPVHILADRCNRVHDAYLNPATPPVMVKADEGAELEDQTGEVRLIIPPGALMEDSEIGVTSLVTPKAIRDRLPPLVASGGRFMDDKEVNQGRFVIISGVFGDETKIPVTLQVPNKYDLPVGTEVRFGKIDHNTLEWMDLETEEGVGVGVVRPDGEGGTLIEVEFDHFCDICTGYCLPYPDPGTDNSGDDGGCKSRCCGTPSPGPGGDNGGNITGDSVVNLREGYLREVISLPTFREMGQPGDLTLAYFSGAASPTVTLAAQIDYDSTRPVERTIFTFDIEGVTTEAVYDFSENNRKHNGNFFWNGRNAPGDLLPTGAYAYSIFATSLNADAPVAISGAFGGEAVRIFNNLTYPGLTPLRSDVIEGRAVLVNLVDSPYGAGWSVVNEHRLHFDPDGCVVLLQDNADALLFVPRKEDPNTYDSPTGEFAALTRNPDDGSYVRTRPDGMQYRFTPSGRLQRVVDRYDHVTEYFYEEGLLARIISPTGFSHDLEYVEGKLVRIIDSADRVTEFEIDPAGNLIAVTDATGSPRTFEYDEAHRLTAQTDPRGARSEYGYDNGRVVETRAFDVNEDPLLRTRTFGPSALDGEAGAALDAGQGTLENPIPVVDHRIDTFIDGRGQTWLRESDLDGHTSRLVDPLGRVTLLVFDENELPTSRTRPNGAVTEFEYDDLGNQTVVRELFDGSTTLREYDGPFSKISRIIDQLGHETTFTYFPNGSLRSVVRPKATSPHSSIRIPRSPI